MYIEKIQNLTHSYENDVDIIEEINDTLNSFTDYLKSVCELENLRNVLKFTMEGNELRDRIESLDKNRSIIHNGVISHVKTLNTLCRNKNIELFFTGNIDNRIEIGDFAGEVVAEIFNNRIR